jgi:hypothetical protein
MDGIRRSQLFLCIGLCSLFACLFIPFFFLNILSTLHTNASSATHIDAQNEELSQHPAPLPPAEFENFNSSGQTIPKIIHRLWSGEPGDVPAEWTNASNSCIDQNPSFEQYDWTDETALEFIQAHFAWFAPSYTNRLKARQREDVLRYFLLWHYGGVYMDHSIGCQAPMDSLGLMNITALAPEPTSSGASNDLIASTANHPFIIAIARNIYDDSMSRMSKYKGLFSTRQISMNSALAMCLQPGTDCADVAVLPSTRYDKTENATFTHYKAQGAYWGNGLAYDRIFGNLFGWTTAGVAVIVMITLVFVVWIRPRRNSRYRLVVQDTHV